MTYQTLKHCIAADQFRYRGGSGWKDFFYLWLHVPGFKFTVVMRACGYLRAQSFSRYGLYHLCLFWHRRLQVKYGAYIDFSCSIGPGLYVPHICAIVVNVRCVIGQDCSMSQGVTLGNTNRRSKHPGTPRLGDRVYLGPGAVVVGGIDIEDDCVIGPNSVVTKPLPPMSVVSGIPAQIISTRGSEGYVTQTTSHPASTPKD